MIHDMEDLIILCLGSFLYSGTAIYIFVFLMTHILQRRRGCWILVVQSLLKIIIVEILLGHVVPFFYGIDRRILLVRIMAALFFIILNYVMIYLVLEGSLLRVGLVTIISELTAVCVVFSVMGVLHHITGRKLWAFGRLHHADLLLPVLSVGILYGFWYIAKPFLIQLRTCSLPFPKFLWGILFVYMLCACLSLFSNYADLSLVVIYGLVLYYAMLLLVIAFCMKYYHVLKQQKRFLEDQKRLLDTNYYLIHKQMAQMEQYHSVVTQQMAEMQYLEGKVKSQNIRRYLEQMREMYQDTYVGIYCNDWEVDAALRMQNRKFQEKKMIFDCYMQEYDRGKIEETDVVQTILILTNFAMDAQKVQLHMAKVKNQLVVKFVLEGQRERKNSLHSLEKQLKLFLRKYEGGLTRIVDGDKSVYIVLFERG